MKRNLTSRFVAAAVIVGAALGAASAAQAHTDVQLSIGLPGLPGLPILLPPPPPLPVFVRPAPVFVRQEPVYVQPRPVYVQPPPEVVYERPWRPEYRDDFEREREWRHAEWQRREWERHHHGWDRSPSPDHRGWR